MSHTKWTLESLQKYGKNYLTAGVSSLFRNNPFTGLPMYLSKAEGAYIYDITGKKYIDHFMGHGAVLLGHKRKEVEDAIRSILSSGFYAEFDSESNIELAKMITEIVPCADQALFTNSGSEATQLAMRLARGYTGKNKIVRIDGHFHGVNDYALFNNLANKIDKDNSGNRSSKVNFHSSGIPKEVADTMIIIPWNNIEAFAGMVKKEKSNIAGIIMNPIDYNNGCITTTREYLSNINDIAHNNDIVVIYDEILSGFRTGLSCAQGYYGTIPDLCTLGKAISNGVPISMLAGKKEIMSKIIDPELPVIHGGTFSGNQFGVAASIASIKIMQQKDFYRDLFEVSDYYYKNLQSLFDDNNIPAKVQHLGSNYFTYFGTDEPVTCYYQFDNIDWSFTKKFYKGCIEEGLYFHTDFTVSAAHTKEDMDLTLETMQKVLNKIK
ncbi:Glutamate-1-semialdehyde 2,1-aminomutase [subsurface metagenome]